MTARRTAHLPGFHGTNYPGRVGVITDATGAWRAQVVAIDNAGDMDVVELLDGEDELPSDWKGEVG